MLNNSYEKDYLNWFCYVATSEEVKEEINAIVDREKSISILQTMLNGLLNEIAQVKELIALSDEEDKKEFLADYEMLLCKKQIFEKVIEDYNNGRKKEEFLEEFGASGVLFATNSYGNIVVEKDLKWIKNNCEESVYQSFIKLIKYLVENKKSFIETIQKPVQPDNGLLKGIFAMKDYQSRLLYRYAGDYIVIIGAAIKKTDLDKKYRKFCVNCKEHTDDFVSMVEKDLVNIDELIEESTNFFGSISNGIGGLS